MFTKKWLEWITKYGVENVVFVVRNIDCMIRNKAAYSWGDMVESYEDALNETIN
jgi:hypothetical protein